MVRFSCSNQKEFSLIDKVMLNVRNQTCCINYHYGSNIDGRYKRWKSKNTICATSGHSEAENYSLMNMIRALIAYLKPFYMFIRPYATFGTISGVISGSLIAVENFSDISPTFLVGLLTAVAAYAFATVYAIGFNQLFDIEIDKVNKPYLPLASGDMNLKTGIATVTTSALLAFIITFIAGSRPLQYGVFIYLLILSAYSVNLPLLRWKNDVIGAIFTTLSSRAIVIQVSSFIHMQTIVFGRQANFSQTLAFGTIIVSIFSVVIAMTKDIPDIEGDQKFGIHSFSAKMGKKRVFWMSVFILEMTYAAVIAFGATSSLQWSKLLTISSHAVLALVLWLRARSVDLNDKSAIQSYYMFIWKLLYTEHLLIPFVR